ncbi:MAG: ABC transporter ATP-binding protein [Bacillota bacterium]|uniref:ABC transporter ATP-binding protein n=1 Tax=Virgibacillus salarius TaxID=447199 RepID=A0A941DV60_9BACI|nr:MULTISPECIES: ABC transporter ATP-binding protein [Bacillaceae]NAZ09970.1 ATP-binding cassette domain-containing protein [Agaribacter marinus]MBR7797260.1 ABC transporter ATP-binding protein [Virgibacillus salarius]MCC2251606.1 ABC transporter ATP-binding protein [Virgibacillus sp. AGTR]MDY7045904.1 ABC transporter ATP-binding protein [Virgibacillus sp. M23]QRZ19616.1 ABC transporter ATP-binding protein [Virgibacillus sp. AGTR]
MNQGIIQTIDIKKHFAIGRQQLVKSVDGISIEIYQGETFGLVGESGSGKSTFGKTIVGLTNPTEGAVYYEGSNVKDLSKKEQQRVNREVQIIFQDPQASLNPRMQVGDIIAEGIDAHGLAKGKQRKERIYDLLERVGMNPDVVKRYPHEFSGGQRQRIGIARTLAVKPKFIVADEPISALDVSIQAQVLNLLNDLKDSEDLTYLFIAHDLSMVKHISDRIGVMYLGSMMELTNSQKLFNEPKHPYTQALLSAVPVPDPTISRRDRIVLQGDPPSPVNPPNGCKFRTRCPHAMEICSLKAPEWKEIQSDHWTACHLYS